ncbi:LacI family DNA-binding transcriptional regulator, partial [Salmonella enterica]|nr:LacI family DNA-binding transcriptional regulator [Salmonella enterica]
MSLSSANSKDVARLANVSQSTVSLVFNGKTKGRVSEDTRARVLAVAKTLGYQPNVSAQILRNGSPKNIAFVVPDLQQPYFGKLVYAAELTAAEKGHSVILLDSISSEQWCDRLITLFQSKVIYGCIIYSCDEIFSNKLQS